MEHLTGWDYFIKLLEIASISFGSVLLSHFLTKKKQRGKDLKEDFERKSKILPILDQLKGELDADRVFELAFSNGDTTLGGHHLKKVSMLLESNKSGRNDIASQFQFVPTKIFERNLAALYESPDEYIVSYEFDKHDELAALYAQYDIKTLILVKVKGQLNNWVGVLAIAFENQRLVTEGELAFCKMQSAKLGIIK